MANRKKEGSTPVSSDGLHGRVRTMTASDLHTGMVVVDAKDAAAGGLLSWTKTELASALDPPKNLSPDDAGKVVGGLVFHDSASKTCRGYVLYEILGQWVTVTRLMVEPDFRRKGVATTLLRELRDMRRRVNLNSELCLSVKDDSTDLQMFLSDWGIKSMIDDEAATPSHTFFLH